MNSSPRPATLPALLLVLLLPASAAPQETPPKPQDADETAELQAVVTSFRGLKFTRKVTVGEYSRDELLAFIRQELERELPRDQAEKIRKALVHFGLIPAELDLYRTVIDLLGSSIAGFYHPKTKELRLIKPGDEAVEPPEMRRITLVHELCHAAQDQNFDLNTLPIEVKTNDDLVYAVHGLVEGDATLVGLKWGLGDQFDTVSRLMISSFKQGDLGEGVRAVPAYLRKTLAFPYGYGTEFVQAVLSRSKDDWTAVSKAFADLPGSTEQVLHPKKYFSENRDHPQDVAIEGVEAILGEGWKLAYHNVHGEFGARLILDEFKVETRAIRQSAAEGWDGDRYFLFEKEGRAPAGVWYSTWDSEEDAKEFLALYAQALETKHEGAERVSTDQRVTLAKAGVLAILERRGADVLVLDGFGGEAVDRLNKIWSAAKKTEVRKVDRVAPQEPK